MAYKYEPTKYNWEEHINSSVKLKKGYVLIKKSFFGRIKVAIVDLEDDAEVVSFKTVSKNLNELSDKDILMLKSYFEGRRMARQVQLLEEELEYRKNLLTNENVARPKKLKTVLKYNIRKKSKKIKRYKTNLKVKIPKKNFFILSTAKRTLKKIDFPKFEFSIKPSFEIINPQKYAKELNKNDLDENKLYNKIYIELLNILKNYLESPNRISKNGKGSNYEFSLDEDLFSDFELRNEILIFGKKYGIEFSPMELYYSKDKKEELEYANLGLSNEQIDRIQANQSILGTEMIKLLGEKKQQKIEQFQDFGISCDENGILNLDDKNIILQFRGEEDNGKVITIFELNELEVVELSKIHTQVIRR